MNSRSALVFLRTWLLPVALCAGAFGLHWALHVPPGPLPPPSPAQIEADKKAADKKKKDAEKKKKDEERKSGKAKAKPERPTVKDMVYEPFGRPRPQHIVEQLWEYYEPKPFKSEPTFEAWQTAHKPILTQIVAAARTTAIPETPAVSVAPSECHTIRCRFTVTGPDQAALDQLVEILKQLELDGGSLWHSFTAGASALEPSKREGVPERYKVELTVSFMRDLPHLEHISVPGKGPLRSPAPTPPMPTATDGLAAPDGKTPPGKTPPGKTPPGKTTPRSTPRSSSTATPSPTGATASDPKPG